MFDTFYEIINDAQKCDVISKSVMFPDNVSIETKIINTIFMEFNTKCAMFTFDESSDENNRKDNNWNIDDCIFNDFPKKYYIIFLSDFIAYGETFHHVFSEYCKLVYILWKKYIDADKTVPNNDLLDNDDKSIIDILHEINILLHDIGSVNNEHEIRNLENVFGGTRYAFWHMFGLFPLLKDKGISYLTKIATFHYDDAQDSIMFGIHQLNPFKYFDNVVDIFEFWNVNQNISFSTGTGMLKEISMILDNYVHIGFDYKKNVNFMNILQNICLYYNDFAKYS